MVILPERPLPARQDAQDTRYRMRTWPAASSILAAYHPMLVVLEGVRTEELGAVRGQTKAMSPPRRLIAVE